MQNNIHLSGSVTIVHQIQGPGFSPPATLADLQAMEHRLMNALDDKIAAANASVLAATASTDALIGRVQTDVAGLTSQVTALNAQIATLQAQIDAGGATPEQLQAMDALVTNVGAIQAKLDAADPTKSATLPPPPTP